MLTIITTPVRAMLLLAALQLAACGGTQRAADAAITRYTVGGAVSGLAGSVVLQNNGRDNLTVAADGNFTFTEKFGSGNTYAVTVLTQPANQTCTVSTGAGTVSGNNVGNVAVTCSVNAYTVGGAVSGLSGTVVLQNNSGDNLNISANGAFTFAAKVAYASSYTVTVLAHPAGQSCSVSNGTGTMAAANITNVAVTCAANFYTVGGTVSGLSGSVVLQNNGADNITVSTNGPFTFPAALTYGNPYNVTLLSQQFPNQDCTISNGSGTILANVGSAAVNCVKHTVPRYAYTANGTGNSVSAFAVDAASGGLSFIGNVAAGAQPQSVTVHPSGKYAYVANNNSANVSQYSIGTNGALSPMAAATVAAGSGARSVMIDPTGKYAYVVNQVANTVSQYGVDATTGALTLLATPTVATGAQPVLISITPSGKYAYVANIGGGNVSQYSIGADGLLTALSTPTVAASMAASVAVDPAGKYAYVANYNNHTVSQYSIGADGSLTALAVPTVATGLTAVSVAVEPSGKYAYVANHGSNSISQYSIGADGSLAPLATVAAGVMPQAITVDPSGKYAYVANGGGNTVSQYSIGADGLLTALSPATVIGAGSPVSIAIAAGL